MENGSKTGKKITGNQSFKDFRLGDKSWNEIRLLIIDQLNWREFTASSIRQYKSVDWLNGLSEDFILMS